MTTLDATLAAIDGATAPACAVCGGPLAGSPSSDYCGETCQASWLANLAEPLPPVLKVGDIVRVARSGEEWWAVVLDQSEAEPSWMVERLDGERRHIAAVEVVARRTPGGAYEPGILALMVRAVSIRRRISGV